MVSKREVLANNELWRVLNGDLSPEEAKNLQAAERAKLKPKKSKKKTHVSESIAQQRIFAWADKQWQWPELKMMYHIPNENSGFGQYTDGQKYGMISKKIREGMKVGIPDIHLPVARCGYHGLWIELKVGYNKPTPQQLECIDELKRLGHYAVWCKGETAAIELISRYMAGDL